MLRSPCESDLKITGIRTDDHWEHCMIFPESGKIETIEDHRIVCNTITKTTVSTCMLIQACSKIEVKEGGARRTLPSSWRR